MDVNCSVWWQHLVHCCDVEGICKGSERMVGS